MYVNTLNSFLLHLQVQSIHNIITADSKSHNAVKRVHFIQFCQFWQFLPIIWHYAQWFCFPIMLKIILAYIIGSSLAIILMNMSIILLTVCIILPIMFMAFRLSFSCLLFPKLYLRLMALQISNSHAYATNQLSSCLLQMFIYSSTIQK